MVYEKIIINEDDGEFNIPGIIKVNKESKRQDLIDMIGGTELKHLTTINSNNNIKTELIVEAYDIRFIFREDKLRFIELILCDENDTGSWEAWNLERELNKLEMQNNWLKTIVLKTPRILKIGQQKQDTITIYDYDWGEIRSMYVGQDGYSYITIKYL